MASTDMAGMMSLGHDRFLFLVMVGSLIFGKNFLLFSDIPSAGISTHRIIPKAPNPFSVTICFP
jgi:hypothetical protein